MTAPATQNVLGCILAGGQSRRMGGGDKTLLEIGGKPMLAHVIERLGPQVSDVILNANGGAQRFESFGLQVVEDTVQGFTGPLAGVLAGMRHAAEASADLTHVATAASDTPFFPRDLVSRLTEKARYHGTVVLATSGGHRHPVFGLWPVALADDLDGWLKTTDTYKVLAWTDRHHLETVDFPAAYTGDGTEIDPFFNVNTPDDMLKAETLWAERQS